MRAEQTMTLRNLRARTRQEQIKWAAQAHQYEFDGVISEIAAELRKVEGQKERPYWNESQTAEKQEFLDLTMLYGRLHGARK